MRAIIASVATAAALFAAAPASAKAGSEPYSVSIAYGDLNLDSVPGRITMQRRINAGADRICSGIGATPLTQMVEARQCRAAFVRSAEQKLQLSMSPPSGAVYAAR